MIASLTLNQLFIRKLIFLPASIINEAVIDDDNDDVGESVGDQVVNLDQWLYDLFGFITACGK